MDTTLAIIIAVIVIAAIMLLAAFLYMRTTQGTKRSERLQERFGPEYDRAVRDSGRGEGEKELQRREERVERFEIRELDPAERQEFSAQWRNVQAEFVDHPDSAILDADDLVQRVMNERGYPMANFEQRAADLSVQHADVVSHYRSGHEISESHRRSPRSTEDLRQAMIHYRALFSDLLGEVPARG
jgi:hypothetical protein